MNRITFISLLLSFITFGLWLLSKPALSSIIVTPVLSIAQITALLGATGYFLAFVLSSRIPWLEKSLPLDQLYSLHRLVGILAGSSIILHVTALITNLLPSPNGLTLYLLPGSDLAYTLGVLSFYLLMSMLLLTIYINLPYNIWKFLHAATSYSIALATLHIYLIPSDVSKYEPLRLWILGLGVIALLAWSYKQFIYSRVAFSHKYKVIEVSPQDAVTFITMSAEQNPLALEPGQFAFFKIFDAENHISREIHPFTVLLTNDSTITLAIKGLGDYTNTLRKMSLGTKVAVAGPHGMFGRAMLNSTKPAVWIAGGIGITPFINVLSYYKKQHIKPNVSLIYSVQNDNNTFHPHLTALSEQMNFPYTFVETTKQARPTAQSITTNLLHPATEYNYFICGPKGLISSMITGLLKLGVGREQIFMEDFDFKTLDI